MKITIIIRKDSDDITGEVIASHNRIKGIISSFPNTDVNLIVIREYMHPILHWIRKSKTIKKEDTFTIENLHYKALWFKFSLLDNILLKLHKKTHFIWKQLDQFIDNIADSDIVIAHSLYAGYIALRTKEKYGIPYTVTWHGSDIHTLPYISPYLKELTTSIIQNANANCFVSRDLMLKSNVLCQANNKYVLYNGVDRMKFHKFNNFEIKRFKKEYNIDNNVKNVAFLGNLFHIKNVLCLPSIFCIVQKKYPLQCHFIGSGSLKNDLERLCIEYKINYRFWGYQNSEKMPSIINCMDMIILPSYNEGLPLVSLEALACGVPMVASRVGGIAEAIGEENTVSLNRNFTENMANLIIEKLSKPQNVSVPECFSWETTSRTECNIIKKIMGL